jgi:branched-subunit amino acid transport protein
MNKLLLIVAGMAAVTYIPRMAPMVLLKDMKLPKFLKSFFEFIPFAALGALIFPGVFSSTGDTGSAIVGCIVSIILALFRLNVMVVVLGGILGVFLVQIFF